MHQANDKLDQAIAKLEKWLSDEEEVLNDIAHDVAGKESVEEMLEVKKEYGVQNAKVEAISEAILLITEK